MWSAGVNDQTWLGHCMIVYKRRIDMKIMISVLIHLSHCSVHIHHIRIVIVIRVAVDRSFVREVLHGC